MPWWRCVPVLIYMWGDACLSFGFYPYWLRVLRDGPHGPCGCACREVVPRARCTCRAPTPMTSGRVLASRALSSPKARRSPQKTSRFVILRGIFGRIPSLGANSITSLSLTVFNAPYHPPIGSATASPGLALLRHPAGLRGGAPASTVQRHPLGPVHRRQAGGLRQGDGGV